MPTNSVWFMEPQHVSDLSFRGRGAGECSQAVSFVVTRRCFLADEHLYLCVQCDGMTPHIKQVNIY